jgi:hypothetical protein
LIEGERVDLLVGGNEDGLAVGYHVVGLLLGYEVGFTVGLTDTKVLGVAVGAALSVADGFTDD